MTKEQEKKLDELNKKLSQLNQQVNECHYEIDKMIVESMADFKGSYVVFFDGDEYVFMKVEMQTIRDNGYIVYLQGPAIRLPDDPTTIKSIKDDDGVEVGTYDEHDGFSLKPAVLDGTAYQHIRKITKKEMAFVLEYYFNTMKENIL